MIDVAKSEDTTAESAKKLFSIGQITLATLIGCPIAGFVLVAQNYRQLGKSEAALQSLLFGLILTFVVFLIATVLPDNFPNMALPVGYTIGIREGVKYLQGDAISDS